MKDTVKLTRVIEGELPFTLNLPEGIYPILDDGTTYEIELQQNRISAAFGHDELWIGSPERLRAQFGASLDSSYIRELRTIVRNQRTVEIQHADLPVPTPDQLFEAAQSHLLRSQPSAISGGPTELQPTVRSWLDNLKAEDRAAFTSETSIRLAAAATFPHRETGHFCEVLNVLIRLYMAQFNDRIVQEITENMFSDTVFRGLRVSLKCNGNEFDSVRHAGGLFAFISPRTWWTHHETEVAAFRTKLETSPTADPVALLHVRARSMLLRGANRSAMLEASAAFDICLVRKIRTGLLAKGKTDPEIEKLLDNNQRYEDRAKRLLKQATGMSAPEIDNTRWDRFKQDRRNRGNIAHSSTEPNTADATEAVENMIELTEKIDQLPI